MAKVDPHPRRATLHDLSMKPLVEGVLRLHEKEATGAFWPHANIEPLVLNHTAIVLMSEDGWTYWVRVAQHKPAELPDSGGCYEFGILSTECSVSLESLR